MSIEKPKQRLAKFLAACGVDSRRKCEAIIAAGRVRVNGRRVDTPALNVEPDTDSVTVDGQPATLERHVYILLYKPRGVTCSNRDDHAENLVADILPDSLGRLFTIGRLDRDSEGLIICTNDGDFAQAVAHPSNEVTKTYHVEIDSRPDKRSLDAMVEGIVHNGETLRAVSVKPLVTDGATQAHTLEFVLNEGKKREIRRLCKAMGWNVQRLVRVAIGPVTDDSLQPGDWRNLTQTEIRALNTESHVQTTLSVPNAIPF